MLAKPPVASGLSKLVAAFANAATRVPPARAWAAIVTLTAAAAALDSVTGTQISFYAFYLVIACLAAWCLGELPGMAIGLGTVLLTGWINGFAHAFPLYGNHLTDVATVWNTAGRLLSSALLVALASGLRCALEQARWRAATDGLTGALNKVSFARGMTAKIAQARHADGVLVIAYVDLDGFRQVNDTLGHAAGDALLCRFAEAAAAAVRGDDLFARVGGDEFMALLRVDTMAHGDIAAERLHARLSAILRAEGHGVTCSIGALVVEAHKVAHVDMLIDAADGLMYEVKRAGKDAIRIARDDLQPISCLQPRRPKPRVLAECAA